MNRSRVLVLLCTSACGSAATDGAGGGTEPQSLELDQVVLTLADFGGIVVGNLDGQADLTYTGSLELTIDNGSTDTLVFTGASLEMWITVGTTPTIDVSEHFSVKLDALPLEVGAGESETTTYRIVISEGLLTVNFEPFAGPVYLCNPFDNSGATGWLTLLGYSENGLHFDHAGPTARVGVTLICGPPP